MTRQETFRKHWTLNGVRYFRNNVGFYECKLGVFTDYQKLLDAVLNHNEEVIKEKSKTMTRITSIATAPQFFKWDDKFIKVCKDTFVEVSSFWLEYENGTFNKKAYSINSYGISSLHNFVHEFVTELTKEEFEAELNKAYQEILNA